MTHASPNYVPGLDGLRALSVTVVMMAHVGFSWLLPAGLGVTTFFFISGYLITLLLWQERERFGQIDMPRFYGRRFLRLMPELVAFVAVAGLVMGPLLSQPLPPLQALANLTYWTNYYSIFDVGGACESCAVTGHLWSLAVEEHFYLIMPAALVLVGFGPRRMAGLFLFVIIACLVWRTIAVTVLGLGPDYTYEATETRLDSIAWGCLAAVIQRSVPGIMDIIQRRAWASFLVGGALLGGSLIWRDPVFRETLRYSFQGLALMLVVLPLINAARLGWIVRILEWPAFRWMGRRSYGAYLWHMAAITFVGLGLGVSGPLEGAGLRDQLMALPLVLGLGWLMAEASYRWIFMPAQRLKPYLMPRRELPVAETAQEGARA
jgi:peptidoglycan/LPS O-acetylase OafA/YrhL